MKWVSERGCVKWVVKRVFVALRCAEEEAERKSGGRESGEVDGGNTTNDGVEEEEEERQAACTQSGCTFTLFIHLL